MCFQTKSFCYGYGYRPHVYNENDDRKCNLSKTLPRVDFFENDSVGKKLRFQNDNAYVLTESLFATFFALRLPLIFI